MIENKVAVDFVIAGQICLDIIPEIPITGATSITDLLRPGKLLNVGPVHLSTGGPVANVGLALKKMGFHVALVARMGNDLFADILRRILEPWDVDTYFRIIQGEQTSYTVAIAPPEIDRMFLHAQGANAGLKAADIPNDLLRKANLFHFGYPPAIASMYRNDGRELKAVFEKARAAGITTSLDLTLPDSESENGQVDWLGILSRVLPYVDIFLPSIEELYFMLDLPGYSKLRKQVGNKEIIDVIPPRIYRKLAEQSLAMGCKIVGIKTGFRGIYLRTSHLVSSQKFGRIRPADLEIWSNRELWCPAFSLPTIASATGSGDSAVAGFLTGFVRGFDPVKTLKLANYLGLQNLTEYDGISGIRSWDDTVKQLKEGIGKMIPIPELSSSGWQWNNQLGLWCGSADKSQL